MTTRFDKKAEDNNSIVMGYEDSGRPHDFVVPSCGLEDLDYAVFNLFNTQLPLYYDHSGENKKVPVIFATGERFAILRRNKPLTDKRGALILPLISITRSSIENVPQKGISNNQIFPEVWTRRVAKENTEWRQLKNFEGFQHIAHTSKTNKTDYNLEHSTSKNIYETIEIPPVKYFGATYEISIWSSFTQQMNDIITTIMSAYTINPGQQFRIESKKGYWFPAFVESSFTQDTSYADYTDAERYVKYNMTLSTTGYILAPNIMGGKVGIKSLKSAPTISFETLLDDIDNSTNFAGVPSNDPSLGIFSDVTTTDDDQIAQIIGGRPVAQMERYLKGDKKNVSTTSQSDLKPYDFVGERSTRQKNYKKVIIKDKEGQFVAVKANISSYGEAIYDQKYASRVFNISNEDN